MLELATKIDAENYRAVMELAPRYAQKGDWEKNKELLIKCLEINPKFSIARSMLSDAYTKLYQFSMALYEIEKVDLTKMPDFEKIAILVQKGTIKMIRGDLYGADLEFQNAHNIGKKTSDNWKHLVNGLYVGWYRCQNDKGDHKRALEILEFHKQYDPDSIPVWNNIGFQYNSLEEYGKAQYAYEHAYKIDNREPNVLMNLGLLYLRKNDDQTALKYFQNAKNSLEEGYEKFTEYQDGERTTKKLLEWMRYTITIITEGSSEDKEQLIIELGGKIQTGEELYPLPPPPVERKSEEYEGISKRCKIAIQNFLRKKYDSDPEKFRKDFPSNYDEAKKRLEQDKIRMHPQKNVDLFSFIDIGVFPFIFKMKIDAWKLDYDSVNLINALYKIKEMRNLKAHDMEMTPNQKEIRFRNEVELIEFFERKIMQ